MREELVFIITVALQSPSLETRATNQLDMLQSLVFESFFLNVFRIVFLDGIEIVSAEFRSARHCSDDPGKLSGFQTDATPLQMAALKLFTAQVFDASDCSICNIRLHTSVRLEVKCSWAEKLIVGRKGNRGGWISSGVCWLAVLAFSRGIPLSDRD